MKKILLILIVLLFQCINVFSQEIVVLKGDTVIVLEKKEVRTLNEIALHRRYLIKELQVCDSLGLIKDSIIIDKEKEILNYQSIVKFNNLKVDLYEDKISDLEKKIIKKERENGIILGGGIFAVLMSILFL